MNELQEITIARHGLEVHSKRKGAIICRDTGTYSIVWPDGSLESYVGSLAVVRAVIQAELTA